MSGREPPAQNPAFDVALDPAPKAEIVEAVEDEEAKARRDAALASTFDPERARAGKTDEELIAEREAANRAMFDVALAVGVIVAVIEAEAAESVTDATGEAAELEIDDPEEEGAPPSEISDGE
ncbi:MAG TPA: hypothetical protein PLK37_14455 [Terricaulis sp.]|nr:hypothetical protein [Terricaulis sp.]